jgi:hypothetical protein
MQLLRVGNSVTIPVAETIVHWLESDESDSLLQLLIPGPDSAGGQGEGSISVSSEPNGRIPDFVSNCNASYAPTSSKAWGLHGSGGSCTITISSRTQAEPYYVGDVQQYGAPRDYTYNIVHGAAHAILPATGSDAAGFVTLYATF